MKSEHRHELAENDLAKLLGRWGAELDKHVNVILSVLIVIVLIATGFYVWSKTSSATSAAGWTELSAARTAEQYVEVAETFPGTKVAEWATLRAANEFLQEGIRLSLTDRPASNERLQQASESFASLLKSPSVPREIREQALMGNALTLETMSDGDTSDAIKAYEALIGEFETTRFQAFAEDRIQTLKTGGVQNFYAWFHQLNPQPAARPLPQDQTSPINTDPLGDLWNLENSSILNTPPSDLAKPPDDALQADDFNPFAEQEMKDKAASDSQDPSAETPAPDNSSSDADVPGGSRDTSPAAEDDSKEKAPTSNGSPSAETPSDGAPPKSAEKNPVPSP